MDGAYAPGDQIEIVGDDAHRIHHVLRLRTGDTLEVCDSTGAVYQAAIVHEGRQVDIVIKILVHAPAPPRLEITLVQCLPKGAKMDFIVEKATELGIYRISPLLSSRVIGERGSALTRHERWQRIARAAAEQSRSQRIPTIDDVQPWSALPNLVAQNDTCIIPWELSTNRLRALETPLAKAKKILLIVGPEGGLSHNEVESVRELGGQDISLGERILRTETAGLVALALVRYAALDM